MTENFQILISTTDDRFFLRHYRPPANFLVINQMIEKRNTSFNLPQCYVFREKGLSRSRNKAIELCKSKIALLGDDDVEYVNNVEETVINAFKENPEADIITFQALKDKNRLFKENYKDVPFWHNIYTLARVSSIEIAFRVEKIKSKNIKFDEDFGLGSTFPTGEEYIFLTDALKKGLKILYLPIPIVIHPETSSGAKFKNNPNLIEAKGAMFYRIFGKKSYLISWIFALKKYKQAEMDPLEFYKLMLRGIKKYKKLKRRNL